MVGATISHFRILEKLGEGGMGVVYKAHDTRLDRPVALKFLPSDLTREPEARERFIHEAKAASALQHPNICTIHDIDETADKQLFIVMDCYEGETLKSRIANCELMKLLILQLRSHKDWLKLTRVVSSTVTSSRGISLSRRME